MPKILVVDDSPTEVFQFKEMLERLGYEVITAENGRDGVLMANSEQPAQDSTGHQATSSSPGRLTDATVPVDAVPSPLRPLEA